jgi:SEC-C motif-containing protein
MSNWPKTARGLLEARYQAFVDGNIDFILESHHPETKEQVDRLSIEAWSKNSQWKGLTIESEKIEGDKTFITFAVKYEKDFETTTHRENAEFRREDGKWFYFDSQFPKGEAIKRDSEKVGRNDPCPCGSGQKFKKCCERSAA